MNSINYPFIEELSQQVKTLHHELKKELDRILSAKPYPNKAGYLVAARAALEQVDVSLDRTLGRIN